MTQTAFKPGFQSVETEYDAIDLAVEGVVPKWLSGLLIRNGPGSFMVGDTRLRHWFDGLAMIQKYEFSAGSVRYSNRFLRTESYANAREGTLTGQFATDEAGLSKVFNWIRNIGPPEPTDNANVHIARLNGELVALTEVPNWVRFDTETLSTTGAFTFADSFTCHMISAHLVHDTHRGEHIGHALEFGRTHQYHLFRIPDGTRRREVIATIPASGKPAYVHSIGVSQRHLVLIETPLRIDLKRAFSPFHEGFFDLLRWEDDRETELTVIDRETGEQVRRLTVDPFFTFHTINTYDTEEGVVIDLVAFEDETIVHSLQLDSLESDGFTGAMPGRARRIYIPFAGQPTHRRLFPGGVELPTVPNERITHQHRYVYAQATDRAGANGLVKLDTERGQSIEYWEEGLYIEEPIPVTRPDGATEDEGVVLATALDTKTERSVLLLFDAETLGEQARISLPQHNPFGFHGRFFSNGNN